MVLVSSRRLGVSSGLIAGGNEDIEFKNHSKVCLVFLVAESYRHRRLVGQDISVKRPEMKSRSISPSLYDKLLTTSPLAAEALGS